MEECRIYCDGACAPNPGKGAYGAVILDLETMASIEICGLSDEEITTNQRMELLAAIKALEALPQSIQHIEVVSDSQYLKCGMEGTYKLKANLDLWKRLKVLTELYLIFWAWVKGHDGDELNERADELANSLLSGIKKISLSK